MKNLIEPRALLRISEYDAAKLCAVHFAVRVQDVFVKNGDDFVVGGLAGFQQLVAQRVGVQHGNIAVAEHGGDRCLARPDSACEADFKHKRALMPHGRGGR